MASEVLRSRKRMIDARLLIVAGILASLQHRQVSAQTPERRYACWGSFGPPVVSAQCPRNTVIQVIRAGLKVQNHVGLCAYNDHDCGCEYGQKGCQMQDVRQLCMGRPACRLDVTQQYINTPTCRGFSDYMYIEFNCVPVELNSVSDICTNTKTKSESGFIRSPSIHHSSRLGRECDCSLTTDADSSIEISVLDFQSDDNNCKQKELQLSYGGQTTSYCQQTTKKIKSNSNTVSIKYHTDGQGGRSSFWLKYQALPANPIKVMCTYRTVETTTEVMQTTTQRHVRTKPEKPKIYKPRKRKGKREKLKKDNNVRDELQALKSTTATVDNSTPWWWRFTENLNATGFMKDRDRTVTTPGDKNLLSDPPKSRRYHSISIPRSRSSSTTSTTTTTENRYQHPNLAHPEAIAGKSSSYFDPKLTPQANFDFSKAAKTTFPKNPESSDGLWSHLPSSLLKKLQFPLPLIRALEKELVMQPEKERKRSFLRVLPALQPNEENDRFQNTGQENIEVAKSINQKKRGNWRLSSTNHDVMSERKAKIRNWIAKQMANSSENQNRLKTEDSFRSYGRDVKEWRVTKSPIRPQPGYFTKKTRFSNMNQALDQLGVSHPEKEKDHHKVVATKYQASENLGIERPNRKIFRKRKQRMFNANENNEFRNNVGGSSDVLAGSKNFSRGSEQQSNYTSTFMPPQMPRQTTTTDRPTTVKPKLRATSTMKQPKKELAEVYPEAGGTVGRSGVSKGNEKKGLLKRMRSKEHDYKVPTSKVAVQPVNWVEPMDQRNQRMYPRERSPYAKRRRLAQRARARYRYGINHEFDTSNEIEGEPMYMRKKGRKIWRRFEPRKVVSPEPRMYVTKGGGMKDEDRNKTEKISKMETTTLPIYKHPDETTTMAVRTTTALAEPRLVDSVHKDRFNVVEELVGKIQTVSDFYKTLDEEDWTSWPAFKKVKNAPDFDGPILTISSSSEIRPPDKPNYTISPPVEPNRKGKPKLKPKPKPKPKPRARVKTYQITPTPTIPTSTTTPTTTTSAPKPQKSNHYNRAHPPNVPPTLDNSIPQMPQSTKMASASSKTIPADQKRRRTPAEPIGANETPNQTESLHGSQNNMVTIIAACVVGSILLLIILGIVIRFIMRRNQDRDDGIHFATAKGLRRKLSSTNFDGRKIPRPKRV